MKRILFLGDSIANGYTQFVEEILRGQGLLGKFEVLFQFGGTSEAVRLKLAELALQHEPAIIQFNCGLHDLAIDVGKTDVRVPIERYGANLLVIVQTLKKETSARLIFATTTPVVEERHNKGGFRRYQKDVERYNSVAVSVMREEGVEIIDLFDCIERNNRERCIGNDGRHMTEFGNQALADAIVESLRLK